MNAMAKNTNKVEENCRQEKITPTPLSPKGTFCVNSGENKTMKCNSPSAVVGPTFTFNKVKTSTSFNSGLNTARGSVVCIQGSGISPQVLNRYAVSPLPARKKMYTLSTPSQDYISARRLSTNRITAM